MNHSVSANTMEIAVCERWCEGLFLHLQNQSKSRFYRAPFPIPFLKANDIHLRNDPRPKMSLDLNNTPEWHFYKWD